MAATSREQMASPNPVPPCRRVGELSACSNARKTVSCLFSGMPIPVSVTVQWRRTPSIVQLLDGDVQDHFARIGELDGIAHQIHHDLAQATRIAHEPFRDVRQDVAGQFESFAVRPQGQRLHRVAEHFPDIERGLLQLQFAGLDLGEIKDVIDDGQQRLAGIADHGQVVPLGIRQRRVEHEFGHADDGVHRRADFMTHVGQEITLRTAGCLGFLDRHLQLHFRPFPFE